VIAVLLILAAAGASASTPETWTTRRALTPSPLVQRGLVEVALDAHVYAGASPALADLRIREVGGAEVAYLVRRDEDPARRTARPATLLDLVTTPQGRTRFVLDAGEGRRQHNAVDLTLEARSQSFRVPVRIETSADQQAWDVARAAGFVYDVSGNTRARDTTVSYPVSTARWVRVSVDPVGDEPLGVRGAAIVLQTPATRREEPVSATLVERVEDVPGKTSRLTLDLGARRPIDRIQLDVEDANFHRVVLVETADDGRQWRWVGSGAISALQTPRGRERQTTLRVPESAGRYVRLTIQNHDARPLRVVGARAAGIRRTLVFEAVPGREYVLDYGNPRAVTPRYDLGPVVRSLAGEQLAQVALGPPVALPPAGRQPWLRGQPVAMWGAMAAAALALAAVLVRLARGLHA
jgi:hypothetical protein